MSQFSFRFQKILNLKENEKNFAQLQMADALKKEQAGLERKQSISSELQAAEQLEREKQQQGVAIAELRSLELYRSQLVEKSRMSNRELRQLQKEVDQSRLQFNEKAKEEKVWEKLKEHETEQFKQQVKAQEQQFFDELAAGRFYRLRQTEHAEGE